MIPIHSVITTIRAIGIEYLRRSTRPLLIIGAGGIVLLLCVGGWLTTQNAWWWILELIFICGAALSITLALIIRLIFVRLSPTLTDVQRQAVKDFVDKLERVAEHVQMPQFMIVFYVVRDTLRPRQRGFIETIANDSKTLAPDFAKLCRQFERAQT